jgi:5,10-methylenetetrahydromethanopterin reductase
VRALLRGEEPVVDGVPLRLIHPEGFAPARPIDVPILVAANGPKGLEVARADGDGVLALADPPAGFAWCALARSGTVLEPGETLASPRVFDALAPAIALVYHATYESAGAAVDHLPGGKAWREAIERVPASAATS